jgi:hypothetical protein
MTIIRRRVKIEQGISTRRVVPLEESTYSDIPEDWKKQDIWLPYHLIPREVGGYDKKPFHFRTGKDSYKEADGHWATCTFTRALEAAREHGGDGVGFQTGGNLVAFDLDAAMENGEPRDWAADALQILGGAYAELSVSGTGIKAIVWCDDPPRGKPVAVKGEGDANHRTSHVQYLGGNGFNAVTGNTINAGTGEPWRRDQVEGACVALGIVLRPEGAVSSAAPVEWNEALVREALSFLDPDCPRDEWIRIGMALHAGGGSEDLWHEWSKGDLTGAKATSYERPKASAAWQSFRASLGGVTIASLYQAARKAGWMQVTPGSEAWLTDHAAAVLRPRLRYIIEDKDWALWDGARWRRWSGVRARRLIHTTNVESKREIITIAAALPQKAQGELIANARSAQTKRVADAVMALLAGTIDGSVWDLDSARTANLLTFRNVTVNLRTGVAQVHDPDLGFSRVVPYDFDPNAKCPIWEKHVAGLFDDPELAEAFRMFVGYTVTGRNDAKVFGIAHGEKDTGKSTTSEAIDHALGMDFAETVKRGVFMRQRSVSDSANSHDANVITLMGRRKLNVHEPEAGARWDEELMKQWTGGDGIALRRIYGETATFRPPGVVWALCNELPKSDEFSDAFWSRALVFPFLRPRPRKEGFLRNMLDQELQGIGTWCVRAAKDYLARVERGESPMLAAQKRTESTIVQARFGKNPLALWVYENYRADPEGGIEIKTLLEKAEFYFRTNPEKTGFTAPALIDGFVTNSLKADALGRVLKSLGFETERVGSGATGKKTVARLIPRE